MPWIRKFSLEVSEQLPANDRSFSSQKINGDTVSLRNGWEIDLFRPFHPLLFFVAFGSEKQMCMLRLSLISLEAFAEFEGTILVATDRDDAMSYVPESLRPSVRLWKPSGCSDVLDYCCVRYRIAEWPEIAAYNPAMYVDTDVLFDAPVTDILKKMAFGERLFFQGSKSERLDFSGGVGAAMFREAGIATHDACGFNTGILGIPLPAEKAPLLDLVRETIYRHALSKDTRSPGWYDQPSTNYVLYLLEAVDDDLLFGAVRWGGRKALHNGRERKGLVHLWGATDKEEEMADFLAILQSQSRKTDDPWIVYAADPPFERTEVVIGL